MKLQKTSPAWHAEVVAELAKDFTEINLLEASAAKRRAYLGLKLIFVKEKGRADDSIPHNDWIPFLERNFPQIKVRTAQSYMAEAESLAERVGWQKRNFCVFEIPPHRLLELPAAKVPESEKKSQQLLLDLIGEKGRFQRRTVYTQVDEEGKPRIGQMKGSKGLTKEQRVLAAERAEQARLNELEETVMERIEWLHEIADAKSLGALGVKLLNKFVIAADVASGFAKQVIKAQKGGQS